MILTVIFCLVKISIAVRIGSSCIYSFQCEKNSFCHEGTCRKASCIINNDCSEGELCIKGKIDGVVKFACFPMDPERAEKMDFCPGGGKPVIGYRNKLETCDANKPCTGRSICNPAFGLCCSKLRICPWPKSALLEGYTHKPLICQFRGLSPTNCPSPAYCEIESGFCCADTNPEKKPDVPFPQISLPGPGPGPVPGNPAPAVKPFPQSLETFVGDACSVRTGCSGGAVCVCKKSSKTECICECPREMGYTVSSDGKFCKRTRRRLKEKCRSDMECQAAFSECTSGGCRCKAGFQRDGNGGCKPVAHKCVNHAEPLKFDNHLTTCVVQKMNRDSELGLEDVVGGNFTVESMALDEAENLRSPKKDKRCPSNYYCVPVFDVPKQPNLYQGFCCPMPQPDIPVCPVGNPHISSAAPEYGCSECPMDHFCHKDSIATQKEICCPKPCVSPDDVYIDNQCYPIAYHGDSCLVPQQCVGKFGPSKEASIHEQVDDMECRKGICECPKGFLIDNDICKRVECTVGLKSEPAVNSLGGILMCQKSADCSQGSMCDPFSKVCCKGINKCPSGFVETGEACKMDKCRHSGDICIVPKNSKSKICCRKED